MPHTIDPSVRAVLNRAFGPLPDDLLECPVMQRQCAAGKPIEFGKPCPKCGARRRDVCDPHYAAMCEQRDDLLSALAELLAAIADPALGPDDGIALEEPYRAAVNRRDAAVENARAVLQATGG